MKRKISFILTFILLSVVLSGCLDKIPTEFTINTEIDTGRDLKNMVDDALADLAVLPSYLVKGFLFFLP